MTRARDMANLGSQAGSGLDASDITTGTLGNTVQDNVTRLGTVTVGNLSNTAIVYPAGHILQTVPYTASVEAAGTGAGLILAIAGARPLSDAGNKILVMSTTPYFYQTYGGSSNTSGSVYGGFQVASSGTGVSVETHKWGSWNSDCIYGYGFAIQGSQEMFLKDLHNAIWLFTPGTTNPTTITVSETGHGDDTPRVNYEGGSEPYENHSVMILHEIQV